MRLIKFPVYSLTKTAKIQDSGFRLPSFSHFPFHQSIHKYIEQRDIHTPTYIQYATWASLYSSKNLTNYHIVSPTGSGKTLTFMLPIVDYIKKSEIQADAKLTKSQRPGGIIITSNKQLVLQVRNVGKDISHFSKIKCEGLGIGKSLIDEKLKVQQGLDIVVSCFLRLKRMLDRRQIFLSNLSYIVVDQIDTLYQSQRSIVQQLFSTIITPKLNMQQKPVVIFSSTTKTPLLQKYLKSKIQNLQLIADKKTHVNLQNIKHQFLHCNQYNKHGPLLEQLKRDKKPKTMIFCNTVKSLHELEYFLNDSGIPTVTLHSQLSKQARLNNYQYFRDIDKGILLSTDLGARGLHFPKLEKVINYDFPLSTCDYLQRAGRTGRAGEKGKVISLYFKKHLPIINELKNASFDSPLKITNSAYGFKNRQQTRHPNKFKRRS